MWYSKETLLQQGLFVLFSMYGKINAPVPLPSDEDNEESNRPTTPVAAGRLQTTQINPQLEIEVCVLVSNVIIINTHDRNIYQLCLSSK